MDDFAKITYFAQNKAYQNRRFVKNTIKIKWKFLTFSTISEIFSFILKSLLNLSKNLTSILDILENHEIL